MKKGKLWCIVYKKRSEGRWFNGIYYFYAGILVDAGNILVGVCDIKNLKRKLRPDEEHKDNSPWNIAADFDIDMSFTSKRTLLWKLWYKMEASVLYQK